MWPFAASFPWRKEAEAWKTVTIVFARTRALDPTASVPINVTARATNSNFDYTSGDDRQTNSVAGRID
jgi:hypothetical protein